MYRIALINIYDEGNYGQRMISASLKANGFAVCNIYGSLNVQQIDHVTQEQITAVDHIVKEFNPDLLGFSIISAFSLPFANQICQHLRTYSNVPILFGGAHPSLAPELTLDQAPVDYICIGEGEDSFVELCRELAAGNSGENVPGIMSKSTMQYIRRDPPMNLDQLPFQDISQENSYIVKSDGTFTNNDPLISGRQNGPWKAMYATRCSRGCPFRCSYCSNSQLRALYSKGAYFRRRTVDNVINELKQYIKQTPHCDFIWFTDDTFPYVHDWVKEFAEKYKTHISRPFRVWLNPKTTKEEDIALLAEAGLYEAYVGIESASAETRRDVFLRSESKEDIANTDAILTKYGIHKVYDFIIDHPWESKTELYDIIDMLSRFKSPFEVNMHSMILLPNTQLSKRAIQEGIIKDDEQLVAYMTSDTKRVAREFQWQNRVPKQNDVRREYMIFLIFRTPSVVMPKWLIRFFAHPIISNNKLISGVFLNSLKAFKKLFFGTLNLLKSSPAK